MVSKSSVQYGIYFVYKISILSHYEYKICTDDHLAVRKKSSKDNATISSENSTSNKWMYGDQVQHRKYVTIGAGDTIQSYFLLIKLNLKH